MFRDKRLFVFIAILCLSIWQIITPRILLIPISKPSTPVYSLYSLNTSSFTYPLSNLTPDDYTRLINVTNFKFEKLNLICENSSPLVLILVHTSPYNFKKRRTIRETWGQRYDKVKVMFMLGKVTNGEIKKDLEEENKTYKDFVQGNFLDSYTNMTYKHGMVFKYAIYHCPQAKYILKTDDDIFVNTPALVDFLTEDLSPYGASNLLLCRIIVNSRVMRSYRNKWRVSYTDYPDHYYPPYCPGWAILYSQDVVFALYSELQRSKYFWIDDVHITGTVREKTSINLTNFSPFTLTDVELNNIIKGKIKDVTKQFLFGSADLLEGEIRSLWNFVVQHNKKGSLLRS